MMSAPQPLKRGIVKQVLSGDSVIIRGQPKGGPPPEKQLSFSSIIAPKLARRATANADETRDEPWAWEAREFLRKKLVGEEVWFTSEKPQNANREYGCVFVGKDPATAENITELLINEGLVTVRRDNNAELNKLRELEDAAKAAGKGKWGNTSPQEHVRDIKWSVDNPRNFVDKCAGKPVEAVIEHVRDGSTVRAFLLPDFYHVTLMISGIRCPGFKLDNDGRPDTSAIVPYAEEARYYVESRLLQRDVQIVLESVNNNNFVGTILHPKGNIAEALLRDGFAKCVDWSIAFMKTGADKLRAAERDAKNRRVRVWKDYQSSAPTVSGKEREFVGTVIEVFNGDALNLRLSNGSVKKVFLSSIRPPKEPGRVADEDGKLPARPKNFRPLYDIPWMYEAREFLRKKLIGKKVNVTVDYIQPARDNFPEKCCCTVSSSGINVAEAMVAKGLATVVRYRQDDDQRSSHYDDLLAAETKAVKSQKGVHAKKESSAHRVADLSGDLTKAKKYLPSLQRAQRTEAVVEFVASGSRLRLYIPKETCLVTFLLAGISCPRGARPGLNGAPTQEAEPYGEEALAFTKERCLQREVQVHIDSMDKAGNFIGWLWVEGSNLSVMLVEEGLSSVHFTAERSPEHIRSLKTAEDSAKLKKLNIWKNYVEQEPEHEDSSVNDKINEEDKQVDRKVTYEKVLVTEVTSEGKFYAQSSDQGARLEALMAKIHQEYTANPPLVGAYTPKKGDLCAARFTQDDQWYRAKVEKVQGGDAHVLYIDYGNREVLPTTRCANLPTAYGYDKPYASEYSLALVLLPTDQEYQDEAIKALTSDILNRELNLNVEYRVSGAPSVTLVDPATEQDIAKGLITDGLLLVEKRRERRLAKLVSEYIAAQDQAKKLHNAIWQYGDITEDDAKEFGAGR